MASLMEELIDLFEQEIDLYGKLVEVSTKKTAIIVRGDVKALEQCTEEEQEIATDVKNLDNRRVAKTLEMAKVINKKPEEMTLLNLIGYLKGRPEDQERLEDIRVRLRAVLDDMKVVNDRNAMLLKQAMDLVEFDLMLYKSMRQAPETANYDKRAYSTGTLLGSGGFDAKQ